MLDYFWFWLMRQFADFAFGIGIIAIFVIVSGLFAICQGLYRIITKK